MSEIAGISVPGPQAPPAFVVTEPSNAPTGEPQVPTSNATQPAVVIRLSSGATASAQAAATSRPLSLDPDLVDNALSWAAGANGEALAYEHIDRTLEVAKFGQAISDRNQAGFVDGLVARASHALDYASSLGIPIKDSASPEAAKNGATPGTISVGAFSFTSGGSTYAVAPGANGTLIGTKDGQAWKTWQLTIPADAAGSGTGATAALQTLTSLNAKQEASADEPLSRIDVSA